MEITKVSSLEECESILFRVPETIIAFLTLLEEEWKWSPWAKQCGIHLSYREIEEIFVPIRVRIFRTDHPSYESEYMWADLLSHPNIHNIVLVAPGGYGKTTLLQWTLLEFCKRARVHIEKGLSPYLVGLPILINASSIHTFVDNQEFHFEEYLKRYLPDTQKHLVHVFMEIFRQNKNACILIDGINEFENYWPAIERWLFHIRSWNCRIIVTTREESAHPFNFQCLHSYVLCSLPEWTGKYFEELAKRWEYTGNIMKIEKITSSPLIATLIYLMNFELDKLFFNPYEAILTFLEEIIQQGYKKANNDAVNKSKIFDALSHCALATYKLVSTYGPQKIHAFSYDEFFSGERDEKLIKIWQASSLFRYKNKTWAFFHSMFGEFLAGYGMALILIEHKDDMSRFKQKIIEYSRLPQWRNIVTAMGWILQKKK